MKIRWIYLFFFLGFYVYSQAQSDSLKLTKRNFWENKSFQVGYQNGYVFQTNDFLKGLNTRAASVDEYQDVFLKFSKQTNGEKLWEQIFKYPSWGFGMYVADFYNHAEIGTPIALYGFLNAPFVRWKHSSFNYEISFGATGNWKSFNPLTNQYNTSIGAGESFFIDGGLNMDVELSKHLDLIAGFSLTHFSNGALKIPNSGINSIAPKVSLKYNLYDRPKFIKHELPKFKPVNEWEISAFVSQKNLVFDTLTNIGILEKYEGAYFTVLGVMATYNHQISRMSKIGIGMNLAYNESVNGQVALQNNDLVDVEGPFMEKFEVSIFPSYELVVNKMSIILQPAFYLYRKNLKNQSPVFHQRIGLKYHISDDIFVGIILRDYAFHVSDFIEWTVGYSIGGK